MATRKQKSITVVISAGAVVAVLAFLLERQPSRAVPTVLPEVRLLRAIDSLEAFTRDSVDHVHALRIDTLQLGVKYLVCRATEEDARGQPRACKGILKDVGDYYQEARR